MLNYDAKRKIIEVDGKEIYPSRNEAKLMELLYQANGGVCSVDDIGKHVYTDSDENAWYDCDLYLSCIEQLVSKLRVRIGQKYPRTGYILNVKKLGYYFRQEDPKVVTIEVTARELEFVRYFRSLSPDNQTQMAARARASSAIRQLPIQLSLFDETRVQ